MDILLASKAIIKQTIAHLKSSKVMRTLVMGMVLWALLPKSGMFRLWPDTWNAPYQLIDESVRCRVLTALIILLVGSKLYNSWGKDKHLTFNRSVFAVFILEILWWENDLAFAPLIGLLDVRLLISSCLVVLLLVRYCMAIRPFKIQKDTLQNGFVSNDFRENECSESKRHFILILIKKLLGTSLAGNAFSVGIAGDWGSGKTTFLELVKRELNDRVYVVNFNPWSYKNSEQVMTDFFNALRQGLNDSHYRVDRPIAEYAAMVTETGMSGLPSVLIKLLRMFNHYTLQNKKRQLSEVLKKMDKPIWVFVDDMDRLEQEEIFEMLRLIRNVGDLSNIVYITAYDKDFVVKMLQKKGVEHSDVYLEKIFDVEFCLPKVEPYELKDRLLGDLKESGVEDGICKVVSNLDMHLILEILSNFRRVQRFARLYSQNLQYMRFEMKDDFNELDLFWLSLLQMYDSETYDNLFYKTELFLTQNMEETGYQLWKGIAPNKSDFVYSKENWPHNVAMKADTPLLLAHLFASTDGVTNCSIRHKTKYRKYFSLIKDKQALSNNEFKSMLERPLQSSVESCIEGWIKDNIKKDSILFHFKYQNKQKLDLLQSKNLVWGLIWLYLFDKGIEDDELCNIVLIKKEFNHNFISELAKYLYDEIRMVIFRQVHPVRLNELLHIFYTSVDAKDWQHELDSSFLTNAQVKNLVEENARGYLQNHPDLELEMMFDIHSEFSAMVRSSVFPVKSDIPYRAKYENFAKNAFLDSIGNIHTQLTKEELMEAYQNMRPAEVISVIDKDNDIPYFLDIQNSKEYYDLYFGTDRKWVDELIKF
jgi:hypothetical protein